jgi:hypothetical protein
MYGVVTDAELRVDEVASRRIRAELAAWSAPGPRGEQID